MINHPNYKALWKLLGAFLWINTCIFILLGVLFEKESVVLMAYFSGGFALINSVIFSKVVNGKNQKTLVLSAHAVTMITLFAVFQYIFSVFVFLKK